MTTNRQRFTTHLIVVDEEEERESTDPTVEEPDRLFNQTVRPLNPKKGDFTTRLPQWLELFRLPRFQGTLIVPCEVLTCSPSSLHNTLRMHGHIM